MPRTWLITGSSRGLGRALAEVVLAAGHRLIATARRPQQLAHLVARYPERARAVALDVTDRAQADDAIQVAVETFGRLDVLVNNAGYANANAIEDFSDADFPLPVLREQRSGHIIQISSLGGRITGAGLGPYQTAKWGVEGFSGVLQKEVGPLGIDVTIIEPGGFRTEWAGSSMTVDDIRDAYQPTVGTATDLRRSGTLMIGDPEKAARAILTISEVENPPLRLLLGSDAYTLARAADEAKIASDEKWKELTLSTDADDATSQLATMRGVIG